jgi:hypothetical protein
MWIPQIASVLNEGLLPKGYYALAEQNTASAWPDVIALEIVPPNDGRGEVGPSPRRREPGRVSVAMPAPRTSITTKTTNISYASLRRTVVIRHVGGHEVTALIEVLSSANKASRAELEAFLRKAQTALKQGVHLMVLDLYPPGRLDPQGIHDELWAALGQEPDQLSRGKPLVAASYEAGNEVTAYLEPFGVGDSLPAMPLFVDDGFYVEVPFEATYQRAFERVPSFWREKVS